MAKKRGYVPDLPSVSGRSDYEVLQATNGSSRRLTGAREAGPQNEGSFILSLTVMRAGHTVSRHKVALDSRALEKEEILRPSRSLCRK